MGNDLRITDEKRQELLRLESGIDIRTAANALNKASGLVKLLGGYDNTYEMLSSLVGLLRSIARYIEEDRPPVQESGASETAP